MLADEKPWWETANADTPEQAREFCRRLGTAQCAALCLQHMSTSTADGRCPEASRVWMKESA